MHLFLRSSQFFGFDLINKAMVDIQLRMLVRYNVLLRFINVPCRFPSFALFLALALVLGAP